MNRFLFPGIFALGSAAAVWVAGGFLWGGHLLALAMTLLIAAVYGYGALELHRFRQGTAALQRALDAPPQEASGLDDWLALLPAGLHTAVRLRIEGARTALPGPALTPYLLGLLVMLGMLGTFLGMVVTLNGAVFALEGTADLQAIRSAFATPIKGLGLAFGTSVAGVATSATLGLLASLCRRERQQASQLLDRLLATALRPFSLTHQRQQVYRALESQAQALPAVAQQLQTLMQQMAQQQQQVGDRLLANQQAFHQELRSVYRELAQSVDSSLHTSLSHSAEVAGQSLRPVLEAALSGMAEQALQVHTRLADQTGSQIDSAVAPLMQRADALLQATQQGLDQQQTQHSARLRELTQALRSELGSLREAEASQAQAAIARLDALQSAVAQHLATLGTALEAPLTRLLNTASEAPRAAADVIHQLRQEVSHSAARDNALLQERSRLLEQLNQLLTTLQHTASQQSGLVDALVSRTATQLDSTGQALNGLTERLEGSAMEVASLGESLGLAVQGFGQANDKMLEQLQRIEGALERSLLRSDDQLAYYVAQAREIIDLSMLSQKQVLQALQAAPVRNATATPTTTAPETA